MYNDSSNLTSTDSSAIIPTLSSEIAKSNFPVNHWGYSLDDNTYKPITIATSGTVLKTTETTSAADTTTINLATKVDLDKPAGTYTNTFVFNVVANEIPIITFDKAFSNAGKSKLDGYYKMQDMTPEICAAVDGPANTTDDISTQLVDTRDNNVYYVSKLLDGNCWMTQNLNLSANSTTMLSVSIQLKTMDSNVLSDKTVTVSREEYSNADTYLPNGVGSPVPIICTSSSNDGENCHYHLGGHYSWYLATAGSGTTSIVDADTLESICPKGWRLPTSNSDTANYSFGKLIDAYSIVNGTDGLNGVELLDSPLWFVRGGGYEYREEDNMVLLRDRGLVGIFWSSRAGSSSDYAYRLIFDSTDINPSDSYYRMRSAFSYNVRCVAE